MKPLVITLIYTLLDSYNEHADRIQYTDEGLNGC